MEKWVDQMRKWCSLQERCSWDSRKKMRRWGASNEQIEEVIERLIQENYLSDDRYLEGYVRTHAEYKRWGPQKIVSGLVAKGFSTDQARKALTGLSDQSVANALEHLAKQRAHELPDNKERVIRYLMGKGYGLSDILKCLSSLKHH
jgi:regulatory protein